MTLARLRSRSALLAAVVGVSLSGLAFAGCGGDEDSAAAPATPPPAATDTMDETATEMKAAEANIVDTATAAGDFTTLVSLLEEAGLAETLAEGGPYTVFAPTDAAFEKVPQETLDALAANPEQLEAVLLYHVVEGEARSGDVAGMSSARTLNGASVELAANGGAVRVDGARVVQADVPASNGVIHAIDEVLIPA